MKDRRYAQMWKTLGVFLFFAVMQMVVSGGAGLLAAAQLKGTGLSAKELDQAVLEQVYAWNPVLILLADGLTIAGLLLWNARKGKQPLADYTGLRRRIGAPGALLCLAAGLTANIWFGLVLNLMPWPDGWMAEYAANSASIGGTDLLSILAVTVAAPCCEELVFRGRIYAGLEVILPGGAAAVLQAVLFGGMHDGAVWMCYAFVLGCILGYVRKLTGSLRGPLLMHFAFNSGSYLFDWFAGRWGDRGAVLTWTLVGSAALFLICMLALNSRYHKEETT